MSTLHRVSRNASANVNVRFISDTSNEEQQFEDCFHIAMVFKPFKPPLIRKPQPQPSSSNGPGTEPAPRETITITDDQDAPPAKKPRLQTESVPRRPLLQVRNQSGLGGGEHGEKEREKKTTGGGDGDGDGSGGERFFNVLW